jgi:U3 small nucleolar RNA-associated protein MPP10
MLAPEEVLAPTSSSDVRARSELTPIEKRARRAKERKARKRKQDALSKAVDKHALVKTGRGSARSKQSTKQEKEAALKSLVKSGKGVTVVGKAGKTL